MPVGYHASNFILLGCLFYHHSEINTPNDREAHTRRRGGDSVCQSRLKVSVVFTRLHSLDLKREMYSLRLAKYELYGQIEDGTEQPWYRIRISLTYILANPNVGRSTQYRETAPSFVRFFRFLLR